MYAPGPGFGGPARAADLHPPEAPTKHASPDNDPAGPGVAHEANTRNEGY